MPYITRTPAHRGSGHKNITNKEHYEFLKGKILLVAREILEGFVGGAMELGRKRRRFKLQTKGVQERMWESSMWKQRPEACLGNSK